MSQKEASERTFRRITLINSVLIGAVGLVLTIIANELITGQNWVAETDTVIVTVLMMVGVGMFLIVGLILYNGYKSSNGGNNETR